MVEFLFSDFLQDPVQYAQAEALWVSCWAVVVPLEGDDWESPWINTTFGDGTPFRDGNPIFSAVCRQRRRGVRVLQQEPLEGLENWHVWIGVSGEGEDEIEELVISCVLTPKTLEDAKWIMGKWVREGRVRGRFDLTTRSP